jgi:branched-chain amino acid transport system ATP-binding protein
MSAILVAEGVHKNFGAVSAAAGISLSFERDSVVSLIGANGAGKTTFLNMVTGYLRPDRGRIRFDGEDLVGRAPREITALGLSRSFQMRRRPRRCSGALPWRPTPASAPDCCPKASASCSTWR